MDLLKSFGVFQKVAEFGSFSRAAENLGIVPSAVSRQINELERWAGVRLINRTTRSSSLTPEGRIYLEKLDQITAGIEDLKALGDSEREIAGHINMTAPMMLGQFVLPDSLIRFKKVNPKVEISVTLINRMVDIVEEGYDVAVRAGALPDSTLVARSAGDVRLCTVASPDYLKRRWTPEHPKDLTDHTCITGTPGATSARWAFETDAKEYTVRVRGDLKVNDSVCLRAYALAGLGITRIPHFYVQDALAANKLVSILPEHGPPPLPVNILYPSSRLMRPALRAFIDSLVDDLRDNVCEPRQP